MLFLNENMSAEVKAIALSLAIFELSSLLVTFFLSALSLAIFELISLSLSQQHS